MLQTHKHTWCDGIMTEHTINSDRNYMRCSCWEVCCINTDIDKYLICVLQESLQAQGNHLLACHWKMFCLAHLHVKSVVYLVFLFIYGIIVDINLDLILLFFLLGFPTLFFPSPPFSQCHFRGRPLDFYCQGLVHCILKWHGKGKYGKILVCTSLLNIYLWHIVHSVFGQEAV